MLALIAEGYTNRAIGEVLHLSEKTVRNHVSQLLRKLGFQRRSQAAAWAGQRRLELPPSNPKSPRRPEAGWVGTPASRVPSGAQHAATRLRRDVTAPRPGRRGSS